jgi:hypothetical protein
MTALLDVTGKIRVEPEVEQKAQKKLYDWRYENSINQGKEALVINGEYNQWRTNSSLSNFQECLYHVNEMNMSAHLSNELHYHYLFYSVRKGKRFQSKKNKQEEADKKAEEALISLIQEFYKYNIVKAKQALKVLTKEQINTIKEKLEKGGSK